MEVKRKGIASEVGASRGGGIKREEAACCEGAGQKAYSEELKAEDTQNKKEIKGGGRRQQTPPLSSLFSFISLIPLLFPLKFLHPSLHGQPLIPNS